MVPLFFSSGNVKGTSTNDERLPAASSMRHSGVPPRAAALSTRKPPRSGLVEKLKMPCRPGSRPVRNVDQATGVIDGSVERRLP